MPLNKVQLMEVPGGPGVVGAIKAGNNITISPDGTISATAGGDPTIGTVTSVAVSGGTTGLTTTGGPITSAGTIVLGGVLSILNGGTGAQDVITARANLGAGTVNSVNVSGGTTGLVFSGGPVTDSGTMTLGGILSIPNGGTGTDNQADALKNILPPQESSAGQYLTTNGSVASWGPVTADGILPSQTGKSGQYLTTNGSAASWGVVSANSVLPVQTGNAGKFLASDGTNVYWAPNSATGPTTTYIKSGSGTFSPAAGTIKMVVQIFGAGGGAGGGGNPTGGGGGGYSTKTYVAPLLGAYAYSVGAGGAGIPPGSQGNGSPGGTTTFDVMTATGGGGGKPSPGVNVGNPGAAGGQGAGGDFNLEGSSSLANELLTGGFGAASMSGCAPYLGGNNSWPNDADNPGSGGSPGAYGSGVGQGNGGPGLIIITQY